MPAAPEASAPPLHDPLLNARRTGYTRSGFAARYHAHRPKPPAALVDVLLQLAGTRRPALVVDLGSGTGISTMQWAPHAERVVGVEPLDEMRAIAESANTSPNVSFTAGVAQQTGVPAGAADIVTCAQSLHHTEPVGTMAEIGRILRSGGVFAAYDYDWPPIVDPEVDDAYAEYQRRRDVLVSGLRRIGWEVESPKATMFVWAKYPAEWRAELLQTDAAGVVAAFPESLP